MASNKNQHFVPKCYLRPFTLDGAGAAINLFNVDRKKFFENASLKNQCSGDYFYGKDENLEQAIQATEGVYSTVLREIQKPRYRLIEEHKSVLQAFWLLQNMRTEAASRRSVEMAMEFDRAASVEALALRLDIRRAVQLAMRTYVDVMDHISDLKSCLVLNRSRIPFVSSDDPAVMTNRWYFQDPRISGRSFGLTASGLICILPLTPEILWIAYDGDVYTLCHEAGWAIARNESDINAFNEHQYLNCFANVYFRNMSHAAVVKSSFSAIENLRLLARHRAHVAVPDRSEGDFQRYRIVSPEEARSGGELLIHSEVLFPKPSRWPNILRWRMNGSVYSNGTGLKYLRAMHAARSSSDRRFWRELSRK